MKTKHILWLLLLLGWHAASAQNTPTSYGIGPFNPGSAPQTCPVSFTANGAGTGSMVDSLSPAQINFSYNGTSTSGSTTGSYTCGTPVTLTPSSTGGSTYAWGSNAFGCSGTGPCTVTPTSTGGSAIVAHWSANGSTTIPSTNFGVGFNAGDPTVSYGQARYWNTCGGAWSTWVSCNAASCVANDANLVYNFATGCNRTTGFDTWSANAYSAGVKSLMINLGSTTPPFATSNSSDTNCSTASTVGGGTSNGQCDPPIDLPANGQNGNSCSNINTEQCNLYVRYNVKNVMQHVTSGGYLANKAPVTAIEPLNEPDNSGANSKVFWTGTYDQQGRIIADLAQLIVGDSNWNFTLTAVSTGCVYSVSSWGTGNPTGATDATFKTTGYYAGYHVNITGFSTGGNNQTNATIQSSTSTSFTLSACAGTAETHSANALVVNTYTGETAAQTQASVGLGAPLSSGVLIQTSSYHPPTVSGQKFECAMYCYNASPNFCKNDNRGGTTNSCTTGGTAFFTTIINEHNKPGNNAPTTLENQIDSATTQVDSALTPQDQAKPLWSPEAAYSSNGFQDGGCDPPSCSSAPPFTNYTDAGMEASYIIRLYIYDEVDNWVQTTFFNWKNGFGSTLANNSYTAIYNEMLGATQPAATKTNQSGSSGNFTYTYTTTYTDATGHAAAFIWDNSLYCSGNSGSATTAVCTNVTRTVSNTYLSWTPLVTITTGGNTYNAGTGYTITSNQLPVTIIPAKLCTVAAASCN